MNCTLCNREAKSSPGTKKDVFISEPFWTLEWKKVNIKEYKQRKQDGRTLYINKVCPECVAKYNNDRPPLGLQDINKIRERGITEEEYYTEHGY